MEETAAAGIATASAVSAAMPEISVPAAILEGAQPL